MYLNSNQDFEKYDVEIEFFNTGAIKIECEKRVKLWLSFSSKCLKGSIYESTYAWFPPLWSTTKKWPLSDSHPHSWKPWSTNDCKYLCFEYYRLVICPFRMSPIFLDCSCRIGDLTYWLENFRFICITVSFPRSGSLPNYTVS